MLQFTCCYKLPYFTLCSLTRNNHFVLRKKKTKKDRVSLSAQNEFKKLDVLVLPNITTSQTGTLTQTQYDSITPRTTIVLSESGTDWFTNNVFRPIRITNNSISCSYMINGVSKTLKGLEVQKETLTYTLREVDLQEAITNSNKL